MAQKAAGEVRVVAARPRLASCSRQKLSATSGLSPYLTLPYLTLPSEGANLTANGCTVYSATAPLLRPWPTLTGIAQAGEGEAGRGAGRCGSVQYQ